MIHICIAFVLAVAAAVGTLTGIAKTTEASHHEVTFRVTITNATDPEQILSPGAWLVHTDPGAFWARDEPASLALERIAEIGSPAEAVSALGAGEIGPAPANGATVVFEVTAEPGDLLSTAQMLVSTNDGFVGLRSVALFDGDTPLEQSIDLRAYDAGTEENTGIGTGFEGGQPDPARGADNVENGTATSEPIVLLDLVSGTQATASIEVIRGEISPPDTGNAGLLSGDDGPAAQQWLGSCPLPAAWQWPALVATIGFLAAAVAYTRRRTA